MTLSSGAHIKLGSYEFKLDKGLDDHYLHRFYDITSEKLQIAGSPGKEQLLPDTLMWTMDDWAGGEGNNIFYADEFDIYHSSGALNPRIRGQLTARPNRTTATVTVGSGERRFLPANYAADAEYVYKVVSKTGAASSAATRYGTYGGSSITIYDNGDSATWATFVGAATLEGKYYGWTGSKLWEFDFDDWDNWATDHYRTVYTAGNVGGDHNGALTTENSVIMWRSSPNRGSEVFEYRGGVGRPLWSPPSAFVIRSACYQNGVVFFAGYWGTEGVSQWGALYALPLDSLRPMHLKWVGRLEGFDYSLPAIASSYGNQILIASGGNHLYVYDAETDGLSVLDYVNDGTFTDCQTYGGYRYALLTSAGLSGNAVYYEDDETSSRETSFNATDDPYTNNFVLTSAKWDLDYPMELKSLVGFYVAMAPMISGQRITVSYSVDGGSWVDTTEITSSTTGASTGRVFVAVATGASTPSFTSMQFRAKLTSDTGVLAPILYSLTAESRLARKREDWELIVRLKDEQSRERPSHRQSRGADLRDWLLATCTVGDTLAFLDGFRYPNENEYSTHSVTVKEVTDLIDEEGEGVCRVLLTAVTEA